jgi:S-adenosylmethionine/arginine decarboxylase-like enzyme
VFTCGEPDQARRAADLLVERFGTREHTRTELQRGRATQPLPAVTSTHR